MATRFQIWVDSPTDANTLSYSALSGDGQRASGFVSGTAASSARVNTMLRQNSLAIAAFMDTIAPNSTVDLRSTMAAVKAEMTTYFGQFAVSASYIDDESHPTSIKLTLKNGNDVYVSLANILTKTIARAVSDKNGNDIVTTYATKYELTTAIQNSVGTLLTTYFPVGAE